MKIWDEGGHRAGHSAPDGAPACETSAKLSSTIPSSRALKYGRARAGSPFFMVSPRYGPRE